jgi:acyl-CoA synthetase (AMP-forming)/AMP-acid ligase II
VSALPDYPATLWGLLARRADETPDDVVLCDTEGRSLRAAEWRQWAERAAAYLYGRGVSEGVAVSWQLPTVIESAIVLMALARLGAVQNPLIPLLRGREVSFITAQTGARLLITPSVWRNFDYESMAREVAAQVGCDLLTVDRGRLPTDDPSILPPVPSGDGNPVRFVYYSSGTTAEPKGGRHTDASAMASANGVIVSMAVRADDCIAVPFPYAHIGGMSFTTAALFTGCRLLFVEIFDAVNSPLAMAEHGPTLLGMALPFFHAYLDAQRRHGPQPLFPRVRAFTSGGAPKPPEIHYQLKETFGVGTLSGWGLTEFPIATSSRVDDTDEEKAETEGSAAPGVDLRVVDADGRLLGPGEEGELRLKGQQMIAGYVDARLDADAFDEHGYFRTGDLGVLGPRGHVRITGRLKDIVIRNAENISTQEIENVLYAHPKIADIAVIGVPDVRTGERACAVVVLAEGVPSLSLAEIIEFCRSEHLATQKIPEQVHVVDALPRNSMGKIQKRELRASVLAAHAP